MLADEGSIFYSELNRRNWEAWHFAGSGDEGGGGVGAVAGAVGMLAIDPSGGGEEHGGVAVALVLREGGAEGAVDEEAGGEGGAVDEEGSLPDGAGRRQAMRTHPANALVDQINGLLSREKQATRQLSLFLAGSLSGR